VHTLLKGTIGGHMIQEDNSQSVTDEKLLSTSEVLRIFNIAKHKLDYLFESRKLRKEDFLTLQNGYRIYR
jgi:hypothetical protein